MASKNSVNKPKLTVNVSKRNQHKANKRAQMEKNGEFQPSRSSGNFVSNQVKSIPVQLYFKDESSLNSSNSNLSSATTTKTLSKKRAKKIARNLKYVQQRKLLVDVQAKHENDMAIDADSVAKVERQKGNGKEKTVLARMKDALWNVLEDSSSQPLVLATGQGTTLGGPSFP
ncbi:hypothetical protein TPHA_0B01190 [Tetrapisispora phaffii CBS 4417]|uniref:Ribosome biogenesis protein ALB1 n=1 Tax=Tetrapisispora phaffii (strain ATCC 24235 / CBS 4417 / NBRC 1672 / NRRL Y-8282 / UCD 70-5) TaxID=1071381 RepID=G8BP60_TETPH|nr:hypothetical protein TPHA_0B01190 [Tetrapisispora phaffii CBS 4417]CCE61791.1 hypothetical protein TPHA_0B01190 [Tetrapisispora phaffii CBS 4417]